MAVPERVQVRMMSDAAGYVEMTHVGRREMPFGELLELVVAVAGLDLPRIVTLLKTGTAVAGSYRYRWEPLCAEETEIQPWLEHFPRAEPDRPFDPSRCLLARIRAGVETIELDRESATRFWPVLMQLSSARIPRYETYSYREQADVYCFEPSEADERALRRAAGLLPVERTTEQVTGLPLEKVTLYVKR